MEVIPTLIIAILFIIFVGNALGNFGILENLVEDSGVVTASQVVVAEIGDIHIGIDP